MAWLLRRFYSKSIQERFAQVLQQDIQGIQANGTYKTERTISSPQSSKIVATSSPQKEKKSVMNLCANNYLGWCNQPDIMAAGKKAIDERGAGMSSVRFICGTQDIHKELEQKLTRFHRGADTILYPSCFDANAGFFEAVFTDQDAIISDELNHASIIDGIRLSKAKRLRYKHSDMADLEGHLQRTSEDGVRFKVVVTDGVFSMDGELAKLVEITNLAQKYDALVFIDECHATGLLGQHGRGTAEQLCVEDRIDFINSTLGKALGGAAGGYTVSKYPEVIEWLRNRSRPYLFSNTLPPAVVGMAAKAVDLLLADPTEDARAYRARTLLHENTQYARHALARAGFTMKGETHPIIPLMLFDAKKAKQMAEALWDQGIYVISFSYPVVPKDQARIRLQISAAHPKRDLEAAVDAIIEQGRRLGVIS